MGLVKIFVEGTTDLNFVQKYLKKTKNLDLRKNLDIFDLGGKDKLKLKLQLLKENSDQKGVNLVIFDADSDLSMRQDELEKIKKENGVSFEYFLFPNNIDTGELEDLLCKIMCHDKKNDIFGCFDNYNSCLVTNSLYGSNIKGRVYAYVDALLSDDNITPYDFYDTALWDLNHDSLKPLKSFLDHYI